MHMCARESQTFLLLYFTALYWYAVVGSVIGFSAKRARWSLKWSWKSNKYPETVELKTLNSLCKSNFTCQMRAQWESAVLFVLRKGWNLCSALNLKMMSNLKSFAYPAAHSSLDWYFHICLNKSHLAGSTRSLTYVYMHKPADELPPWCALRCSYVPRKVSTYLSCIRLQNTCKLIDQACCSQQTKFPHICILSHH